jgi:hypothetical protein
MLEKINKKTKKLVVATVLLAVGTAATSVYYFFNSKTKEEYTEYYTKELIKLANSRDEIAFNLKELDYESQELTNKYGRFLVKVKDVRKCLDGYKITFSVGNQSNITFPNPKVKLKWNHLRKEYNPQDILDMPKEYYGDWNKKYHKENEDWSNSFKEKEFTSLKDLTKGDWTDLEFIIIPCNSEQFEHVEFSIVG